MVSFYIVMFLRYSKLASGGHHPGFRHLISPGKIMQSSDWFHSLGDAELAKEPCLNSKMVTNFEDDCHQDFNNISWKRHARLQAQNIVQRTVDLLIAMESVECTCQHMFKCVLSSYLHRIASLIQSSWLLLSLVYIGHLYQYSLCISQSQYSGVMGITTGRPKHFLAMTALPSTWGSITKVIVDISVVFCGCFWSFCLFFIIWCQDSGYLWILLIGIFLEQCSMNTLWTRALMLNILYLTKAQPA